MGRGGGGGEGRKGWISRKQLDADKNRKIRFKDQFQNDTLFHRYLCSSIPIICRKMNQKTIIRLMALYYIEIA